MPALIGLRRRVADEGGFTMIVTMGVLIVLSALAFGAYSAVSADIRPAAHTDEVKRAYDAAEAGLGWYESQLALNPNALTTCVGPTVVSGALTAAADNLQPNGGPYTNPWTQVDPADATNKEQFAIEALPVTGSTCQAGETSMVDPQTGTFRVRVTGRARPDVGSAPNVDAAPRRSIIATFRRTAFSDFAYFSDVETADPALQEIEQSVPGTISTPDYGTWAAARCGAGQYWAERKDSMWKGTISYAGTGTAQMPCFEGQFKGTSDSINGPFHSNDSIMLCGGPTSGGPTFGSSASDTVEVSDATTSAVRDASNDTRLPGNIWTCSNTWTDPRSSGTPLMQTGAPMLQVPSTLPSTTGWSPAPTTYTGTHTIQLLGANMSVDGGLSQPIPAGGIYVTRTAACTYDPLNPASSPAACGTVKIYGNYSKDLTVFAQDDIVITGNLQRTGNDAVLGLVAGNWVRVDHPTSPGAPVYSNANGRCTTANKPTLASLTIQAAMLSLTHSFVLDNWACTNNPAGVGTLSVTGSIAGKFHPVTTPPWGGTGDTVSYTYDQRLAYHPPPHFPQPVGGTWRVVRTAEQSPPPSGL